MSVLNSDGLSRLWAHVLALVSNKVDAEDGKGLSTNDYTAEEKAKLETIEDSANFTTMDASLTIEGAAADAKAVGDAVADLSSLIGDMSVSTQISEALANETVAQAIADAAGNVITDTYATKSRTAAITIPVSAWADCDTCPYMSYPVECSIVTANNNVIVCCGNAPASEGLLPDIIPESDYELIAEAQLSVYHQTDGALHFIAYGTKPTIDIPVRVMEVG